VPPCFLVACVSCCSGKERAVDAALGELGVVTSKDDPRLRTEMAYGMFDTRGTVRFCFLAYM
jgi:hypothetical protein